MKEAGVFSGGSTAFGDNCGGVALDKSEAFFIGVPEFFLAGATFCTDLVVS